MSEGIKLLLDGSRGIYIPQTFMNCFDLESWNVSHLKSKEFDNPDNEWYFDEWHNVLDNAKYIDENGNTWFLYQDSDLFAVCDELMTEEEKERF